MNHLQIYLAPKYKELKALGYYVSSPFPSTETSLVNVLSAYGSPYARFINNYLECTGNFRNPTQVAVSILAYAINNPNQFGSSLDNAVLQCIININRIVMRRMMNKGYIQSGKYYPMSITWNNSHTDQIFNALYNESKMLASKVNGTYKPYTESSWYYKLINKQK